MTYEQVGNWFEVRVSNVHVGAQVSVVDPWVGLCSVYLGLNVGFLGKTQRNWTIGRVVGGYLVSVLGRGFVFFVTGPNWV